MPEEPPSSSDPEAPRRKFAFKTPTFPVDNVPASTPSEHPTDVREHFRHAEAIRQAAAKNPPEPRKNEVHAILHDNLARADAAGLNDVKPVAKRPNRRLRDYLIVAAAFNIPVVTLGLIFRREPVGFVCLLAAFVLFNIRLAWILFVVGDKY